MEQQRRVAVAGACFFALLVGVVTFMALKETPQERSKRVFYEERAARAATMVELQADIDRLRCARVGCPVVRVID